MVQRSILRGSKRASWSTFVRAYCGAIAAVGFFTVEVVSLVGLVRYRVFSVIKLATGSFTEPHHETW